MAVNAVITEDYQTAMSINIEQSSNLANTPQQLPGASTQDDDRPSVTSALNTLHPNASSNDVVDILCAMSVLRLQLYEPFVNDIWQVSEQIRRSSKLLAYWKSPCLLMDWLVFHVCCKVDLLLH